MTYTEKIREFSATELPKQKPKREALLSGLLYCAEFDGAKLLMTYSSPFSAYAAKDLSRLLRNVTAIIEEKPFASRKDYLFSIENEKFAAFAEELTASVPSFAERPEELSCFLRGLFLACGRISDPDAEAHLEFTFSKECQGLGLKELLENAALPSPGMSKRRNKYVVYYKSRDKICDILTAMDVGSFVFEYLNRSIYKSIEWNERRAINFISGNINRAVIAGEKQTAACLFMLEKDKGALLSPDLYTTATLRVNNQNLSLSELASKHTPPLTKSGLNHRLTKIMELAKKYGYPQE